MKCCLLFKSPLTDYFFNNKPLEQDTHEDMACAEDMTCEDNSQNNNLKIRLKLGFNKHDGTIFLAYASEEFAELLISFLTYPLGSVVRKLKCKTGLGSIDALYTSIANLDGVYLSPSASDRLVKPLVAHNLDSEMRMVPYDDMQQSSFNCYARRQSTSVKDLMYFTKDDLYLTNEVNPEKSPIRKLSLVQKCATESGKRIVKGPNMYLIHRSLMFSVYTPTLEIFRTLYPDDLTSVTEKIFTIGQRKVTNFNLLDL